MKRVETGAGRAATFALVSLATGSLLLVAHDGRAASSADVDAVVSQTHAAKSGDDFLPPPTVPSACAWTGSSRPATTCTAIASR